MPLLMEIEDFFCNNVTKLFEFLQSYIQKIIQYTMMKLFFMTYYMETLINLPSLLLSN